MFYVDYSSASKGAGQIQYIQLIFVSSDDGRDSKLQLENLISLLVILRIYL